MDNVYYAGLNSDGVFGFHFTPENLQDGWVTVSEEEHTKLLEENSQGKLIKFEKGKKPYTVENVPSEKEILKRELFELKKYLSETDYIAAKLAEGVATKEEYATELKKRQQARDRINEINKLLS